MLRLEVITTQWSAEGEVFGGGVHEIAKPSRTLLGLIAAAEAAGAVVVLDASREERAGLKGHVESQADGEKAYLKAVADGRWRHGNLAQHVAALEDRLAVALRDTGLTVDEKAATVDRLETELAEARDLLAGVEEPS